LRKFTRLKCQLMPYLYSQAIQTTEHGIPLMRAMHLEFPEDPTCDYLDRQYMLGESLLVAPIFSEAGAVTYYVPSGRWTNFFTSTAVTGPTWIHETHDFMSLPLLVRPNSVIAVGSHSDRPDYDYGEDVTLHVYALADGERASAVVPSVNGRVDMTFMVHREGQQITVEREGADKHWQLLLVGLTTVASVEGAAVEQTPKGVLVVPTPNTKRLQISLGNGA